MGKGIQESRWLALVQLAKELKETRLSHHLGDASYNCAQFQISNPIQKLIETETERNWTDPGWNVMTFASFWAYSI